jgi:hypothetical protein
MNFDTTQLVSWELSGELQGENQDRALVGRSPRTPPRKVAGPTAHFDCAFIGLLFIDCAVVTSAAVVFIPLNHASLRSCFGTVRRHE